MISRYVIQPRKHRDSNHQTVFRYLFKSDVLEKDKSFHKYMELNNKQTMILEDEDVYLWEDFCLWHNRRY